LRDLARRAHGGELPSLAAARRMQDEEIVERLVPVRGIGRWTVEMLLIFRLGRPDVLPADDYGVRKGFAVAFRRPELPSRDELLRRGARWSPYRTVASWYLWRAAEQGGRRQPADAQRGEAERRPAARARAVSEREGPARTARTASVKVRQG
jgi:3-methyladenine DNA glycosylase/8-oxoguanine DNA glycosylase